ncbi:MAG: glucose 1-dehydrogenase [Calditrichaeota bacterium]|nr:glucose 1-dehydrogenase [Calditrichota bacterium]RQW00944.1 MAG: glucose 1-dehydrogenase [Calditrichota bacterium]
MARLEGKTAIVTGGSLGIGKSCCIEMAKEGANIAVTDLQDNEGKEVVEEIKENGGSARYWHMDVTNEKEVESVFKEVKDVWGSIDVLVNNAGIAGVNKPPHEITEKEWDQVMDVNVKGVFFCTKYAIPYMKEAGGGSIIHLSSIYGIISAADIPPYHASKGAVRLMAKTEALFYARDNIRVNSVHPGYIWTPLVEDLGKQHPDGVEAFRKHLDSLHPIGHVGEPEDIAYGVIYLASDESKFVTGSEFVIDGGYTVR